MPSIYPFGRPGSNHRRARVLPRQECRPNSRVPLDPEINELVAEARGIIAAGLDAGHLEPFPVVTVVDGVVSRRYARLGGIAAALLRAEVVEAVLADPVTRMALRQVGMHLA